MDDLPLPVDPVSKVNLPTGNSKSRSRSSNVESLSLAPAESACSCAPELDACHLKEAFSKATRSSSGELVAGGTTMSSLFKDEAQSSTSGSARKVSIRCIDTYAASDHHQIHTLALCNQVEKIQPDPPCSKAKICPGSCVMGPCTCENTSMATNALDAVSFSPAIRV